MTQSTHDILGTELRRAELAESELYRVLADQRRRIALDVLIERGAPLTVRDLAVAVADRTDSAEAETIDSVAVALHHVHLPLLSEHGIVEYDPVTNRIETCPELPDSPAV